MTAFGTSRTCWHVRCLTAFEAITDITRPIRLPRLGSPMLRPLPPAPAPPIAEALGTTKITVKSHPGWLGYTTI
jgi:hypothetical protein